MKTPLGFDDYTEVLPEHEMDQDVRKALKEMSEALTGLIQVTGRLAETATQSTGTSIDGQIEKLEERSKWHRNVGWGIAGLYGLAFLAIMTWWIPREVSNARDGIKSDTAAQLLPLQLQLAKLTALAELSQSKDVARTIQQAADFSTPRPAIEAVKLIAQQARVDKLAVVPSVLQEVNAKIQNAVSNNPRLNDEACAARLALVDYMSALQQPPEGNGRKIPTPPEVPPRFRLTGSW
jgi:hypothetical protein